MASTYLDRRAITNLSDRKIRVTTDCRRLLQQLAFSKLRHINRDILPANTMAYDNLPHNWSYQGEVMRKKTLSFR